MDGNLHPVDELGDIRERIKALREREAQLRDAILAQACTMDGDNWSAQIKDVVQRRVDPEKVLKMVGRDAYQLVLSTHDVIMVRTTRR